MMAQSEGELTDSWFWGFCVSRQRWRTTNEQTGMLHVHTRVARSRLWCSTRGGRLGKAPTKPLRTTGGLHKRRGPWENACGAYGNGQEVSPVDVGCVRMDTSLRDQANRATE
ncbi:hypothetical protein TRVL_04154 [Trypanosoma vivax]|nr:hypothetical protein TRVL_04154 [Trypanosoma vivax]